MKLYELSEMFLNLEEQLGVENGEYDHIIENALNDKSIQWKDKVEGICKMIKNIEGDIPSIDNEIKRLQQLKKTKTNQVESLKDYIKINMKNLNVNKVETSLFKLSLRKPTEIVKIIDDKAIPKEYIKTITEIDKISLKKDLKDGKIIEGTEIVKGKEGLQIR